MSNFEKVANKKIPKWLAWGGTIIVIIYCVYAVMTKQNELETYGVETDAIITAYEWGNKGIKDIEYKFFVGESEIVGYDQASYLPCALTEEKDEGCIGAKVKVIYSSRDPEINELLLEE